MNKKRALVIDGNSLMYRMFYATKNLADYAVKNNLVPVNAVKLFLTTCLKLRNHNYDYCLVAFDHGKKTFRHNQFDDYKSSRRMMPDELLSQIPLIKQTLSLIGFKYHSIENFEADDLIGTFCQLMNKNDIHVDIYSSDKDMLQLVNELTYVHLMKTGISEEIINTIDNFQELNMSLLPNQIPDFKAIVGDKSDSLPGIKGIGEKTGLKLLKEFNCLENLYANIDDSIFNDLNNFVINDLKVDDLKNFLIEYKINNLLKYL